MSSFDPPSLQEVLDAPQEAPLPASQKPGEVWKAIRFILDGIEQNPERHIDPLVAYLKRIDHTRAHAYVAATLFNLHTRDPIAGSDEGAIQACLESEHAAFLHEAPGKMDYEIDKLLDYWEQHGLGEYEADRYHFSPSHQDPSPGSWAREQTDEEKIWEGLKAPTGELACQGADLQRAWPRKDILEKRRQILHNMPSPSPAFVQRVLEEMPYQALCLLDNLELQDTRALQAMEENRTQILPLLLEDELPVEFDDSSYPLEQASLREVIDWIAQSISTPLTEDGYEEWEPEVDAEDPAQLSWASMRGIYRGQRTLDKPVLEEALGQEVIEQALDTMSNTYRFPDAAPAFLERFWGKVLSEYSMDSQRLNQFWRQLRKMELSEEPLAEDERGFRQDIMHDIANHPSGNPQLWGEMLEAQEQLSLNEDLLLSHIIHRGGGQTAEVFQQIREHPYFFKLDPKA